MGLFVLLKWSLGWPRPTKHKVIIWRGSDFLNSFEHVCWFGEQQKRSHNLRDIQLSDVWKKTFWIKKNGLNFPIFSGIIFVGGNLLACVLMKGTLPNNLRYGIEIFLLAGCLDLRTLTLTWMAWDKPNVTGILGRCFWPNEIIFHQPRFLLK